MIHSDKEILKSAIALGKEALILDSLCRSATTEERDKVEQLKKVAALAGTVCGCDIEYRKDDEDTAFGGGC